MIMFSSLFQCIRSLRMWHKSTMSWTTPWVWGSTDSGRTCCCTSCTPNPVLGSWMWRVEQVRQMCPPCTREILKLSSHLRWVWDPLLQVILRSVSWTTSAHSKRGRGGGRHGPARRQRGRTFQRGTPTRTDPWSPRPWCVTSTRRCWMWASRKLTAWASPVVSFRMTSQTFEQDADVKLTLVSGLCYRTVVGGGGCRGAALWWWPVWYLHHRFWHSKCHSCRSGNW